MMRRIIVPLLSLTLLGGCVVAGGPGFHSGPVYARPWGGGFGYVPPPRPYFGPPAYAFRGPPPRHWGGGHHRGWGGPPRGFHRGHGHGHWR